tara:strand:- start:2 stop:382 length:381 start_codon:yes stop_codon:yes gene_type:complete
VAKELRQHIDLKPLRRIFDVGFSDSGILRAFAEVLGQHGREACPAAILASGSRSHRVLSARPVGRLSFTRATRTAEKIDLEGADLVINYDVLKHLLNPVGERQRLAEVCSSKTYLFGLHKLSPQLG